MLLQRNKHQIISKKEYFATFTTFSSQHLKDLETSIAKQMEIYMKQKTCRNENPTKISGEHNIKLSYPCMNALHCLENLYAVILPFVS